MQDFGIRRYNNSLIYLSLLCRQNLKDDGPWEVDQKYLIVDPAPDTIEIENDVYERMNNDFEFDPYDTEVVDREYYNFKNQPNGYGTSNHLSPHQYHSKTNIVK